MNRWVDGILRARRWILAAVLGLSFWFGAQALHLRPEWNEQAEFPSDDPHLATFREFLSRFGGQEFMMVVVQADEVFSPDVLGYLGELTEALREVPRATDVVSLSTAVLVRRSADGVRMEPFFEEPPTTREEAERLGREALAQPLWRGTLVSADGRTACINVMLPPMSTQANERTESVEAAREILRQHPHPGVQVFLTGYSPLAADMLAALNRDLIHFLWLTPVLILMCLAWAFRTWRGVWVPSLLIGVAVLWTLGLLARGGGTLNVCTVLLPTLVAINCLSYVIHLLNAYHESCARGRDHRGILILTWVHLMPALFMAAFTTAIGFGSQMLSDLHSLRELGLYSALGILISVLLCAVWVPALLAGLPLPARKAHRHGNVRWLRRGLWRVAAFVNRDTWRIPLLLLLLAVLSWAGIGRIRVESQLSWHLPESAPSVRGLRVVEEKLAGFQVLELVLEGAPGTFGEPWALEQIELLQRHAAGLEKVDQVLSVNDFFREALRARQEEKALPSTRGQISEMRLLFSASGQDRLLDSFLTRDGGAARIAVRIGNTTTREQLELVREIERFAAGNLDRRLSFRATGVVHLFAVKFNALVRSLVQSFGVAFLFILVVMAIQLRSLKAGVCAMVPNVLPIVLGFGLMGFLDIPLSVSTVMIASVGIGIAVDDTIHFLLRYRRELRRIRHPRQAVRRTLLETGRAMVYSSLGLALGFSILLFSSFRPNREFGLLTAFIMAVALLADLFVTPYLVRVFHLFEEKQP